MRHLQESVESYNYLKDRAKTKFSPKAVEQPKLYSDYRLRPDPPARYIIWHDMTADKIYAKDFMVPESNSKKVREEKAKHWRFFKMSVAWLARNVQVNLAEAQKLKGRMRELAKVIERQRGEGEIVTRYLAL